MKKFLFGVAVLLLLLLISTSSLVQSSTITETPVVGTDDNLKGFCDTKCNGRCAKAGMQDRCLQFCKGCCLECKCVPSGTYGHKDECACYRDKKNSKGTSKCP